MVQLRLFRLASLAEQPFEGAIVIFTRQFGSM
jgi:hypothetical protein